MARMQGHVGAVHAKVLALTDLEVFYRPRDLILNVLKRLERGSDRDGQSRRERMGVGQRSRFAAGRFQCQRHRPPRALLSAARQGVAVKERPRHDLPDPGFVACARLACAVGGHMRRGPRD